MFMITIEVVHCNFQCEKLVWGFLFAYLDENSRHGKYYKVTIANQKEYYKINVDNTKFQPTMIGQKQCSWDYGVT